MEQFRQPSDAEMHQKSLIQSILQITPILAKVIEQGIQEKVMSVAFPHETVGFLLASQEVFQ